MMAALSVETMAVEMVVTRAEKLVEMMAAQMVFLTAETKVVLTGGETVEKKAVSSAVLRVAIWVGSTVA